MDGGLDKVFYMLILADVLALVVSHSERKKYMYACVRCMYIQGRSHTFKTGRAQAAKIILGPFYLKKWRDPTLLLL